MLHLLELSKDLLILGACKVAIVMYYGCSTSIVFDNDNSILSHRMSTLFYTYQARASLTPQMKLSPPEE